MSAQTTYDDMRDSLREKLKECEKMAKELVISDGAIAK